MNNKTCTLFVILTLATINGCANTVQFEDAPDYADYSPGYTGYTVGYDGYGTYDDGYGPSFWNPRYYFYTGDNHGYRNRGNQH
ncbi:MAG: hypothetical protein A3E88_05890 [Legionellales bacterium RIFCSPHIGHO2_12_FULL_35_11]|nr:MAG: hypothetical protein A3E88_05890 [Legionellales bacterium RIFCSPHIGHO2_12_FULL_35_11]